jgi:hypothetical protein
MELAITLLFWLVFYTSGSMHWNQTETYVHPIFLYITPCLCLLFEGALNQVIFDIANLKWVVIIYLCYVPFTYLGKFALGYYPYFFITWDTFYSYFMLFFLGLIQVICYLALMYLNNRLKRDQMDRNA